MGRRRTGTESAPVETQEFTQGTIGKGIERLNRRIAEVAQIDPNRIRYNDPSVKNVESQIRNSILKVFGPNSLEYQEHKRLRILPLAIALNGTETEKRQGYVDGLSRTVTMLKGLIKRLEEEQTELASDEAHKSSLTASDTPKTCKGHCPRCGEDTNAEIVTSHSEHSDWEVIWAIDEYQVLRCLGCERVYFRHAYYFSEAADHDGDIDPQVTFWPSPKNREQPSWLDQLSDELLRDLLDEVYGALDADHRVLAAIGTRTALDRAMVLTGAHEAQGFREKLDQLLVKGIIGGDEKKILGKLTDAGSAAAHRGWKPEPTELDTLIDGMEIFLHRALVLEKAVHTMEDVMPPKPRRERKPKGGPES